ncbi:MAG: site-2 protease family protein [Thermodesulfobacteria bacterium]|nr:site-2 protease family protein [Thermodesulfobacteriota bacterium]
MTDIPSLIQKILILTPPILFAVTIHEVAHGWAAWKLGDPTAKAMGRLTLNPIKHLDPIGTLVFFLTQMIGWAKPVPVNPLNFKNPRRDMIWVALAGPTANILTAVVSALILKSLIGPLTTVDPSFGYIMRPLLYMAFVSIQINIGLAVFNLIPIPPLDGSKVLAGILPRNMLHHYEALERYGFIILLVLIFTGVTDRIIVPLINYANRLLIGPII